MACRRAEDGVGTDGADDMDGSGQVAAPEELAVAVEAVGEAVVRTDDDVFFFIRILPADSGGHAELVACGEGLDGLSDGAVEVDFPFVAADDERTLFAVDERRGDAFASSGELAAPYLAAFVAEDGRVVIACAAKDFELTIAVHVGGFDGTGGADDFEVPLLFPVEIQRIDAPVLTGGENRVVAVSFQIRDTDDVAERLCAIISKRICPDRSPVLFDGFQRVVLAGQQKLQQAVFVQIGGGDVIDLRLDGE